MKNTRYELAKLYDRQTGQAWHWQNFPMNTPVMLVRSGGRMRLKPLRYPEKKRRATPADRNNNQISLL
jgi:hypothetical protein